MAQRQTSAWSSESEHRHLTPPSSGRPKGRFAPFGPPLMSNVMPLKHLLSLRTATIVLLLSCAPLAYAIAWPAHVLQSVGFSCLKEQVCAEDPARLQEASQLYESALKFLASSVAPLQKQPLAVFCSTLSCYSFTGETGSAAKTVGKFIIVISPRGWKLFF